jgi:hypothetical protein
MPWCLLRPLVVPVDIAANQIIALTAAAHRTHQLPKDNIAHPLNPKNPINHPQARVPCYNVASGLPTYYQLHWRTLNKNENKLPKHTISYRKIFHIFGGFMVKAINFDNSRTRKAIGLAPFSPDGTPNAQGLRSQPARAKKSRSSRFSLPSAIRCKIAHCLHKTSGDAVVVVTSQHAISDKPLVSQHEQVSATEQTSTAPTNTISDNVHAQTPETGAVETGPLAGWADPTIQCGMLPISGHDALERRWGKLGGVDSPGWEGYVKFVKEAMEKQGPGSVVY